MAWRQRIRLDDLYENADVSQFEAVSRLMPQWTGRRTRDGVPLFVYSVAKIQTKDLLTTSKADPSLSSVFLPAEYSTRFVLPVCAVLHPSRAMPRLAHIIDLNGVGIRHFWSLRSHLQKVSGMATNHYPESVDKIFIVGAPSFFPTIWGYITKWFDPTITSKIIVLPTGKAQEALTGWIDPSDLPVAFGGYLDWEYGMPPKFDTEIGSLLNISGEDWTDGPLVFESARQGDPELSECSIVAVGTLPNKQARRFPIARLTQASISY